MGSKPKKKMTNKQIMFCKEYMIDKNATQAAIRAGYSKKTAHVIGPENLEKPIIVNYLRMEMEKQSKRLEITSDRIARELEKIAFKEDKELEKRKCPYKANDKIKSLELLAKHKNMFAEDNAREVTVKMMDNVKLDDKSIIPNVGDAVD